MKMLTRKWQVLAYTLLAILPNAGRAECVYCVEVHRQCAETRKENRRLTNDLVNDHPLPTQIEMDEKDTRTMIDPGWESAGCECDIEDATPVWPLVRDVRYDRTHQTEVSRRSREIVRDDPDGVTVIITYEEVRLKGIVKITQSCLKFRCDAEEHA